MQKPQQKVASGSSPSHGVAAAKTVASGTTFPRIPTVTAPPSTVSPRRVSTGEHRIMNTVDTEPVNPTTHGDRAKDLMERAFILGVVKANSKFQLLKKHARKEISLQSSAEDIGMIPDPEKLAAPRYQDRREMNLQWNF